MLIRDSIGLRRSGEDHSQLNKDLIAPQDSKLLQFLMSIQSDGRNPAAARVACKSSYVRRRAKNLQLLQSLSRSKQYETFVNFKEVSYS